jgi:hypothetical protein
MSSPYTLHQGHLKSGARLPLLKNLKTANQHSRLHRAFGSLMSSAALLLPISTGAESHLQMGAPGAALKATAHVDFKIVIPPVLSLDVNERSVRVPGAQPVTVMSNSRNVTLAATAARSDTARGNIILSAAARKVIAQDAFCTLGPVHVARTPPPAAATSGGSRMEARALEARDRAASDPRPVICTASMP